jgi:hypothetical protein
VEQFHRFFTPSTRARQSSIQTWRIIRVTSDTLWTPQPREQKASRSSVRVRASLRKGKSAMQLYVALALQLMKMRNFHILMPLRLVIALISKAAPTCVIMDILSTKKQQDLPVTPSRVWQQVSLLSRQGACQCRVALHPSTLTPE